MEYWMKWHCPDTESDLHFPDEQIPKQTADQASRSKLGVVSVADGRSLQGENITKRENDSTNSSVARPLAAAYL